MTQSCCDGVHAWRPIESPGGHRTPVPCREYRLALEAALIAATDNPDAPRQLLLMLAGLERPAGRLEMDTPQIEQEEHGHLCSACRREEPISGRVWCRPCYERFYRSIGEDPSKWLDGSALPPLPSTASVPSQRAASDQLQAT